AEAGRRELYMISEKMKTKNFGPSKIIPPACVDGPAHPLGRCRPVGLRIDLAICPMQPELDSNGEKNHSWFLCVLP
ncbi:hypothetical protein, partial [Bradyrhizobium sp. STM 3809]|uniref:hypothetical protein n=1 Tax=Bradyrhizobium sp. STM 3809 TaxID=551936 RepID=UPI001AEC4A4B